MSEIATPPPNTLQLPSYGGSLNPNFRVPEFHPMEMPRSYVAPLGEIVGQALKAYDAERQYRDQAPAREAAKATNQAYLASIGQGNGGLAANEEPASLGDRAFSSLGHLFSGTLGQHENDGADAPAASKPLANLANVPGTAASTSAGTGALSGLGRAGIGDPSKGSWATGAGGLPQWAPFHRDPAQDAFTNENARRLRISNDAAEAATQARPVTPIQVHDPATGSVAPLSSSGGGASAAAPSASDLPAADGGVTSLALMNKNGDPPTPAPLSALAPPEAPLPAAVNAGPRAGTPAGDRRLAANLPTGGDEGELPTAGPSLAPAPAAGSVATVRSTSYGGPTEKTPDRWTSSGQTSTQGPLAPASATMAGTASVDPGIYPYGTILKGQDGKVYVAGDTGTDVKAQVASGGKAPVVDIFKGDGQPDWQGMQIIPPEADYAKLSRAEKVAYHQLAATKYGGTRVAPDAALSLAGNASPAPVTAAAPLANLPLPPAADAPASRPLAFLPSPLALADTPQTSAGGALANLSADLGLPALNASALAKAPVASFEAGPAVSGAENPFPSRPTVAAPANGAPALATAAGPTVLDPAVYGYRHGFMRPGPNGAKYFETTNDGSGDTLSPYVTSPTQGSPVIDPTTGKAVPGVLMVGNQIVRQPGGANAAAAGAMNLDDLSPEQKLQARALATDLFGRKAGADPASVNLVADQLRAGKSREEIRGLAGQVSPMLGVAGKYNSDPQVKTYLNTVANYQTVKDIAEKPADKITKQDDLSLLFAYVKADNPTMGVTEGSFKVAAAQGTFGDAVQRLYNQVTNTNQTLTPQQRAGFRDAALSKLIGQRETYSLARDRYQGIASYVGANPDVALGADVKPFTDADVARIKGGSGRGAADPAAPATSATPTAPLPAAGPPVVVNVNSQAQYDQLPSGAVYVDSQGRTGRKR